MQSKTGSNNDHLSSLLVPRPISVNWLLRKDLPEEPSGARLAKCRLPANRAIQWWPVEVIYSLKVWDLLDAQSSVGGPPVKKRPIVLKLSLLVSLALVVVIVYGVRGSYVARAHRAACHRTNLENFNSLEPSMATINTEVQEIQQDQDVIDQLGGTDDETVIQRRDRMIDNVKLKLTKVTKDRAENQRRTEQIQTELSSCLAEVK